jgi:hypothetical protein
MYGHKWTNNFSTPEMLETALNEWGAALDKTHVDIIHKAANYCRAHLEWPPSISEFKKICITLEDKSKFYESKMLNVGLPTDPDYREFFKLSEEICKVIRADKPHLTYAEDFKRVHNEYKRLSKEIEMQYPHINNQGHYKWLEIARRLHPVVVI